MYALTVYERGVDGSLTINTLTHNFMQMSGCHTPDQHLATALGWYDTFPRANDMGPAINID